MNKIFILLSLVILSLPAWSQDYGDEDQYPEADPTSVESSEFNQQRGLPTSDYEDVPREEQEYVQDQNEEAAPEEVYESNEEYLE
jgi:hypothetical protein